jgi:hypothetical protein
MEMKTWIKCFLLSRKVLRRQGPLPGRFNLPIIDYLLENKAEIIACTA